MRKGYIIVNKKRINYVDDDKVITFADGKVIGAKTALMDVAASYKQAVVPVVIKPIFSDYKFSWPTSKLKIMATRVTSSADGSFLDYPNNGTLKRNATGNTVFTIVSDKRIQLQNDVILPVGTNTINYTDFPDGTPVKAFFDSVVQLAQSVLSFGTSTTTQNIVNWTNVLNATNYALKRSLNSDMSGASTVYSGALRAFIDTGLTENTTYYYQVTASAFGYTASVSTILSKSTSSGGSTYTLSLNLVGTDVGYTPVWPAGFPNGVGTFTAGEVVTIILEFDGYSVDNSGIDSLVMDSNKTITITATKNPPVFIPQNFNIGSDGVTKSPGKLVIAALNYNLKAILSNVGEEYYSNLVVTGIQAFWHPSMLQTNTYVVTGLTSANEPVAGSDIKSGIGYEENAMVLKTPTGQISTGFYLPQATTSGWRTLAVKGTTNWMIYSFYSINGGNNWYALDGGVPFDSGILKTASLYGQVSMSESRDGLTIDLIKYLTV